MLILACYLYDIFPTWVIAFLGMWYLIRAILYVYIRDKEERKLYQGISSNRERIEICMGEIKHLRSDVVHDLGLIQNQVDNLKREVERLKR